MANNSHIFKARNKDKQKDFDQDTRWTPQDLWEEINEEYHFTLDAAASVKNTKCERFYTIDDDALEHSWSGERVWCNPPYSTLKDWVE